MRKMNRYGFYFMLFFNVFFIAAQQQKPLQGSYNFQKQFSVLKNAFIQWENSQDTLADYYAYLNNSETVLTGSDISFLNNQNNRLLNVLREVDTFESEINSSVAVSEAIQMQSVFLRIKSLESFFEFAEVCKNNTKVFNVLNETSYTYQRLHGEFYDTASYLFNEKFVLRIIEDWKIFSSDAYKLPEAEAVKTTFFYNEFLRSPYGQQASLAVFGGIVKEHKQTKFRYLVDEFNDNFIDTSSRLISNFLGFFRIRKGKLSKDASFIRDVNKGILPLDILLEKTPFRLTDKLIPGYWSHAAVYVGNEAQLKAIGIWEHPLVQPYHKKIRKGSTIVEALRTNVAINGFDSFSNVDSYAQLRLKVMPDRATQQAMLLKVFAQIGKEYDFRFNIESSEKMVCTEIHYLTYEMLNFEPTKNLGAYSISVDDLAEHGLSGFALQPVTLYIDGEKVTKELQKTYDGLLKKNFKTQDSIN